MLHYLKILFMLHYLKKIFRKEDPRLKDWIKKQKNERRR